MIGPNKATDGRAALRGFRQKYRGAREEARGKQKGPVLGLSPAVLQIAK